MDAEKLVFLTDIEGVFIDPANKKTLISEMDIKTAKEFIENGVVGGGMLPKLNNCIDAIDRRFQSTYFRWSCSTLSASGVLYRKGYWYRYFKRTSFLGTVLSEFFSTHFCGQFSTSFT